MLPWQTHMALLGQRLLIAFVFTHGCWLPVRRVDSAGVEHLYQPVTHALGTTLGEQARITQQMITQFQIIVPDLVAPVVRGCKVKALMTYGCAMRMAGLPLRPEFAQQMEVVDFLAREIPSGNANLSFSPQLPSDLAFEAWPEDAACYDIPWQKRLQATHRAQLEVRHFCRLNTS